MTPIEWLERAIIRSVPGSVFRRRMIELIDDDEYGPLDWKSYASISNFKRGNADDTFRL